MYDLLLKMRGIKFLIYILIISLVLPEMYSCNAPSELGRERGLSDKQKLSYGKSRSDGKRGGHRKGFIGGSRSVSSAGRGSTQSVIGASQAQRKRKAKREKKRSLSRKRHYKSVGHGRKNSGSPNVSHVQRPSKEENKDRKRTMNKKRKGFWLWKK